MKKFLKSLVNYDFWKSYQAEKNLKEALVIFFDSEDDELQKLFLKNFSYPSDMTDKPIRLNPDSTEIYYVINFNSKELFYNEATLQAAFAQSLSILQINLPLGVTQYLEPEITGRLEGSFSILITLTPSYEYLNNMNIIKALIKPVSIVVGLFASIALILNYV
tara:strand:+ start:279 stop:767 length:489 start_codon:yes stop_codon:yes gene_type:complete